MSGATRLLDLPEVRAGMTLAEDILDTDGAILLARGTPIDDAALLSLQYWNIGKVTVADAEDAAAGSSAETQQIEARLDLLFRRCRSHAASEALLQSVRSYRQEDAP